MTQSVYFVEMNSPDLDATKRFFVEAFGWDPQPFADPSYLVAPSSSDGGVDTAILPSRDGQPRTVPVIRVDSIEEARAKVERFGGSLVVEPFSIPGVGRGCYFTDPAGLLIGLHEYDPSAS